MLGIKPEMALKMLKKELPNWEQSISNKLKELEEEHKIDETDTVAVFCARVPEVNKVGFFVAVMDDQGNVRKPLQKFDFEPGVQEFLNKGIL